MGLKSTKRYMVIFNIWDDKKFKETRTEYDDIKDVKVETNLLDEMYADTPKPERILSEKGWKKEYNKYTISYDDGRKYWGYLVLDFDKNEIVKYGNGGIKLYGKKTDQRLVKDKFFRGEDEVPKGYKWDIGEYEGWLQYRWGNGLNAIGLEEKKTGMDKIKNNDKEEFVEVDDLDDGYCDDIQEKYDRILDKENVERLVNRW